MTRQQAHWKSAWRDSFRRVSWQIALIITAVVGTILLIGIFGENNGQFNFIMRSIEIVLPLAVGTQAALLFSPEDETPLEVLLACPRPAYWILRERLLALAIIYLSVALSLTLLQTRLPVADPFPTLIARWFAPGIVMSGIGAFIAVNSRRGVLGVLVVILLWLGTMAATIFGGDSLLVLVPELYPIFPYAQPGILSPEQYAINRVVLVTLGAGLVLLALWRTRDTVYLLGL